MKKTVTIGIPAYNEESNIKNLIIDLKKQVAENYVLDAIIVASDGSRDNTVKIVRKFLDERIHCIDLKKRNGVAMTQNYILDQSESDILILMNADTSIKDTFFIEHIIKPILDNKADLVTPEFKQLIPQTFFERVLYRSAELKTALYEKYKKGLNVYTCAGPARAFSKRLYKKLQFKDSANEDAYSFLYTTTNGFTYQHIHDTAVYFRLPNNFTDHKKQSGRFFHSKRRLIDEFGPKMVEHSYHIPFSIVASQIIKYIIRYPIEIGLYGCILFYSRLTSLHSEKSNTSDLWQSATSSKVLIK